jgi:hypothetical protein
VWRVLLLGLVLANALGFRAFACDLADAPTTRWQVVREQRVAWLMTPCGRRFFSLGVNVVDGGASGAHLGRAHYDWRHTDRSLRGWSQRIRARLRRWGFNSVGAWSLPPRQLKMPGTIDLELGRQAQFHWFDPFDPAMAGRMNKMARALTAPYRDSPYRIGYFSDNEVGWWSGALFVFYIRKPAANFTKRRLVELLRHDYGDDWRRFTTDFAPPAGVHSWAALLGSTKATRLRPGGHGIRAVRRWTYLVARRYYQLAAAAIHQADPDALYLGDRLPIYYDPAAIRAEAPYVDVIATNYNVDSPEGWVAPYYFDGLRVLSGGRPVLVSEWFYAARENRTGNRNNGHLMTVETQAERARGAAAAAAAFAAFPDLVGLHWFQLYDYPVGGRADREDYNFGLVDIRDRPYERLVEALTRANRAIPTIHVAAASDDPPRRPVLAIPFAKVDFTHRSFIDWPKATAPLPPLRPSPGAVDFGEAMLSWSDRGLALATVGQDYYDPDLLDYRVAFPLSEAYRVELDVDAGAGPRRFTLYFIPPPRGAARHPPMAPRLCRGAASEHLDDACPPVPGGQALYFGADQPRVAAEMRLPWSALGLDGPPADGKLKIEVSSTAWFNSRWMSLSGQSPARGAAAPQFWHEAILADRAQRD